MPLIDCGRAELGPKHRRRLQLQQTSIRIAIHLPLQRNLYRSVAGIGELNAECANVRVDVVAVDEIPVFQIRRGDIQSQITLRHGDVDPRTRSPGDAQSDPTAPELPLFFQSHRMERLRCHFVVGRGHFHHDRRRMTRVPPGQHWPARKCIAFRSGCVVGIDLRDAGKCVGPHLKL